MVAGYILFRAGKMNARWLLLIGCVVYNFAGSEELVIDRFSDCVEDSGIPCGWHSSQRDVGMFSVVSEGGNFFVRIRTEGGNTSIGRQKNYESREYPWLHWRWRAHALPQGADERDRRSSDSGAGVYVIFKGRFRLNRIIKYVWSTSLSVGTVIRSPFNPRARVVVLQSGEDNIGRWVRERVNVYEDYNRFFGSNPPLVEGIGFMSDGHETVSFVKADYDDFTVTRR